MDFRADDASRKQPADGQSPGIDGGGHGPAGMEVTGSGSIMGGFTIDRAVRKAHPPKLYRIGEVVDYSGMSRQTIHNYTVMGLLRESKWTHGGHRLYDESVFERLDIITALRRQHNSLDVIREQLEKFPGSQRQEDAPALG